MVHGAGGTLLQQVNTMIVCTCLALVVLLVQVKLPPGTAASTRRAAQVCMRAKTPHSHQNANNLHVCITAHACNLICGGLETSLRRSNFSCGGAEEGAGAALRPARRRQDALLHHHGLDDVEREATAHSDAKRMLDVTTCAKSALHLSRWLRSACSAQSLLRSLTNNAHVVCLDFAVCCRSLPSGCAH
jgi:hypothetical protein